MAEDLDEIELRVAKSRRFLDAARLLTTAELFDVATGRAYYAAFHAAIALMLATGVVPDDEDRWPHGSVQRGFIRRATRDLVRRYRYLYLERLGGDYMTDPISAQRATRATRDAAAVISFIEGEIARIEAEKSDEVS